jgi:hypothetical protein
MEAEWLRKLTHEAYVRMAEQADYRALAPPVKIDPDDPRPWPPAPLSPEERRQVDIEAANYAAGFDRLVVFKRLVVEGKPPVTYREALIFLLEALRAMCAAPIGSFHPYSCMTEKRLVELALEAIEAEDRATWEHAKATEERERSQAGETHRVRPDEE